MRSARLQTEPVAACASADTAMSVDVEDEAEEQEVEALPRVASPRQGSPARDRRQGGAVSLVAVAGGRHQRLAVSLWRCYHPQTLDTDGRSLRVSDGVCRSGCKCICAMKQCVTLSVCSVTFPSVSHIWS